MGGYLLLTLLVGRQYLHDICPRRNMAFAMLRDRGFLITQMIDDREIGRLCHELQLLRVRAFLALEDAALSLQELRSSLAERQGVRVDWFAADRCVSAGTGSASPGEEEERNSETRIPDPLVGFGSALCVSLLSERTGTDAIRRHIPPRLIASPSIKKE
jgi:hypothetical protein